MQRRINMQRDKHISATCIINGTIFRFSLIYMWHIIVSCFIYLFFFLFLSDTHLEHHIPMHELEVVAVLPKICHTYFRSDKNVIGLNQNMYKVIVTIFCYAVVTWAKSCNNYYYRYVQKFVGINGVSFVSIFLCLISWCFELWGINPEWNVPLETGWLSHVMIDDN